MVSITNVFQYYISKQSEEICRLKTSGLVKESFEKIAYVSPDGKSFINRNSRRLDRAAGWKLAKVSYDKVTGFMSPGHPNWKLCLSAKRRASMLLTARLILKSSDESIPDFKTLQQKIRDGELCHHAARGKERNLCIQAYRYLKKIDNRLNNRPEKVSFVQTWLTNREKGRAALKESQDV
jgi:hypothetical protein